MTVTRGMYRSLQNTGLFLLTQVSRFAAVKGEGKKPPHIGIRCLVLLCPYVLHKHVLSSSETSSRFFLSINSYSVTDEENVRLWIAQTTAAVTKLTVIWDDKNNAYTISSKIRLMRSLLMSICLYTCDTWTLTADIKRRIQAMEIRCFLKLLGITYRDHITK